MHDISVCEVRGYHDGYYWDYRVWFFCGEEKYTLINVGSGSGYIPAFISIGRGFRDLAEGTRKIDNSFEMFDILDTIADLREYVHMLGDRDELVLVDEENDKFWKGDE